MLLPKRIPLSVCWLLLLFSCTDEDPVEKPKSSQKLIHSFIITSLSQPIVGTIDGTNRQIVLTVPFGTPLILSPTLVISEDAAVVPASGEEQDFSIPVKYLVIAEDGSKAEYIVEVKVNPPDLNIISVPEGTIYERGESVAVVGAYFDPGHMQVFLLKEDIPYEMEVSASNETSLQFLISHEIPIGNYTLKIAADERTATYVEELTIETETPIITMVDPEITTASGEVTITGSYFDPIPENNMVKMNAGGFTFLAEVSTASDSQLTVIIPATLFDGSYTLAVTKAGKVSNELNIRIGPPPPIISTVEPLICKAGEVLTVTGEYLRHPDFFTILYFWPATSGLVVQRLVTPNDEGTIIEYTIPENIDPGVYTIQIEVNFVFSNVFEFPITLVVD